MVTQKLVQRHPKRERIYWNLNQHCASGKRSIGGLVRHHNVTSDRRNDLRLPGIFSNQVYPWKNPKRACFTSSWALSTCSCFPCNSKLDSIARRATSDEVDHAEREWPKASAQNRRTVLLFERTQERS